MVRVGGARVRVEFRGFCLLYNMVVRFSGGSGGLSPALGSPQGSSNQNACRFTARAWPGQKIFLQIVIRNALIIHLSLLVSFCLSNFSQKAY